MPVIPETRTPGDADRLAQLRTLFPELLTDGRIDAEALTALLEGEGAERETGGEHYGLTWPGKEKARRRASAAPKVTLRPVPGRGVDEGQTQNLLLVGDNLGILQSIQKAYTESVKLVYIDPPYNTGEDFIYNDNFKVEVEQYLQDTGQADQEGRLQTNTQSSGRFHTDWLNFIYPRLVVARRLLRDDGFLVVSIDDREVSNLRLVLNEVMGEENFIATLVWDRNRKNDAKFFSVGHEYMLVFAKSKSSLVENGTVLRAPKEGVAQVRELFESLRKEYGDDWKKVRVGLKEFFDGVSDDDPIKPLARYNLVDQDGPFEKGNLNWPGPGGPKYEVLHPVTGKPCKQPASGWRLPTKARFDEEQAAGKIVFGVDETTTPRAKVCLFESTSQVMVSVNYSYAQTAAQRFEALFSGKRVFDNPKPFDDLAGLINYLTGPDDLIVDFFAGSGSTGHGVWLANQKYKTQRRFLLVQLDVAVDPKTESGKNALAAGLPTIDAITAERLRRVSAQLKAEGASGDLGFRVLREAAPAFARPSTIDLRPKPAQAGLFSATGAAPSPAIPASPADHFPEILLLRGFPLDATAGPAHQIQSNLAWRFTHPRRSVPLLICLDATIEPELVDELNAYPAHTFVCLDDALRDPLKNQLHDTDHTLVTL